MGRHKKYNTEEERKAAKKEANRRWWITHPDYQSEYRQSNKEKIAEYQAEYRKNNKEYFAAYHADYYQNNKEKLAEYHADYYQNNKEKIVDYCQNNKEKIAKRHADYYQNNKEKIAAKNAEYRSTQNGRAIQHICGYRKNDKKYNRGECTLTPEWIVEHILNQPCHYCGRTDWTKMGCDRIDNSLPHTPENCVPCCAECNKKRGTTPYEEFMKKIGKIA